MTTQPAATPSRDRPPQARPPPRPYPTTTLEIPDWGNQASVFQPRQPAFWLLAAVLVITGLILLAPRARASPGGADRVAPLDRPPRALRRARCSRPSTSSTSSSASRSRCSPPRSSGAASSRSPSRRPPTPPGSRSSRRSSARSSPRDVGPGAHRPVGRGDAQVPRHRHDLPDRALRDRRPLRRLRLRRADRPRLRGRREPPLLHPVRRPAPAPAASSGPSSGCTSIRVIAGGLYIHVLFTGIAGMGFAYYVTRLDQPRQRRLQFAVGGVRARGARRTSSGTRRSSASCSATTRARSTGSCSAAVKGLPFFIFLVLMVRLAPGASSAGSSGAVAGHVGGDALDARRRQDARRPCGRAVGARQATWAARRARAASKLVGRLQSAQLSLAMMATRSGDDPGRARQAGRAASARIRTDIAKLPDAPSRWSWHGRARRRPLWPARQAWAIDRHPGGRHPGVGADAPRAAGGLQVVGPARRLAPDDAAGRRPRAARRAAHRRLGAGRAIERLDRLGRRPTARGRRP